MLKLLYSNRPWEDTYVVIFTSRSNMKLFGTRLMGSRGRGTQQFIKGGSARGPASSLLFFFAKLLQEKPKHASSDKRGRLVLIRYCNIASRFAITLGLQLVYEVQPLTLLYTIFHLKGTPFVYVSYNGTPFACLV